MGTREPFDRITILLPPEPALELPWHPRDLRIDELNALGSAQPIINDFERAGASSSIVFDQQRSGCSLM
jgi:hypothetical protein